MLRAAAPSSPPPSLSPLHTHNTPPSNSTHLARRRADRRVPVGAVVEVAVVPELVARLAVDVLVEVAAVLDALVARRVGGVLAEGYVIKDVRQRGEARRRADDDDGRRRRGRRGRRRQRAAGSRSAAASQQHDARAPSTLHPTSACLPPSPRRPKPARSTPRTVFVAPCASLSVGRRRRGRHLLARSRAAAAATRALS